MIPYLAYRIHACRAQPLLMSMRLPMLFGAILEIRSLTTSDP